MSPLFIERINQGLSLNLGVRRINTQKIKEAKKATFAFGTLPSNLTKVKFSSRHIFSKRSDRRIRKTRGRRGQEKYLMFF